MTIKTKKEDIVIALKSLTKAVKNSDEIDQYNFQVYNESEEIAKSREYWKEYRPTGWINVDFNIRFYKQTKPT